MRVEGDDKCNGQDSCEMRCEYCVPAGCLWTAWGTTGQHGGTTGPQLPPFVFPSTMQCKLKTACLIIMLNALTFGMRRGPHHPHGQTPVEQRHHHYKPRGSESLTGDAQLLHDTKHIEEDTNILTAEALSKMTPEELEFHYFSAHDFDKNSMLDGLELLKAVYHTIEHEAPDPDADSSIEPEATNDLDAYIALVDRTLESDDKDGDGYVSYAEYRAARANSPSDRTPRVLAGHSP